MPSRLQHLGSAVIEGPRRSISGFGTSGAAIESSCGSIRWCTLTPVGYRRTGLRWVNIVPARIQYCWTVGIFISPKPVLDHGNWVAVVKSDRCLTRTWAWWKVSSRQASQGNSRGAGQLHLKCFPVAPTSSYTISSKRQALSQLGRNAHLKAEIYISLDKIEP